MRAVWPLMDEPRTLPHHLSPFSLVPAVGGHASQLWFIQEGTTLFLYEEPTI